jgi:hypothetical protein
MEQKEHFGGAVFGYRHLRKLDRSAECIALCFIRKNLDL